MKIFYAGGTKQKKRHNNTLLLKINFIAEKVAIHTIMEVVYSLNTNSYEARNLDFLHVCMHDIIIIIITYKKLIACWLNSYFVNIITFTGLISMFLLKVTRNEVQDPEPSLILKVEHHTVYKREKEENNAHTYANG